MAIPLRRCHATMLVLDPSPSNSTIINIASNSPATSSAAAAILPPPALPSPSVPSPSTPSPLPSTSSSVPLTFPSVPSSSSSIPSSSSSIPSSSSSIPSSSSPSTPPDSEVLPKKKERKLKPAPKAKGPPPNPANPFPYQRCYACGPKLCEWCAKDRPPIGHKRPIPDFVVSTLIRHAMPKRFETLEQIQEREVATGLRDPPKDKKVGERDGDDMEYGPAGGFVPPAWTSDKARPKKPCLRKRESNRFTPYPSRSTPAPLVRRSTEGIKASLDEALANRIALNYEGPIAIAIRNEISALHVPNEVPFKWEPEYTGPPSEAFQDADQPLDGTAPDFEPMAVDFASPSQEDIEDEAAVVELLLPSHGKKRRYDDDEEEDENNIIHKPVEGSPTKKPRRTRNLISAKFPGFVKPLSIFPSASSILPSLSLTTISTPSPARSTSPSITSTAVSSDSSPEGGSSSQPSDADSQSSSPRKERIATKKLRFQFTNPASKHPKFGITDSIYLHHRRIESTSKNVRSSKKHKSYTPLAKTWSLPELEWASWNKEEWDRIRKASLEKKTTRGSLEDRVKRSDAIDASAERFQKLVDRYEAGWPAIDLAGVRARYIRPRKNEVPREKNKEATPVLGHLDEIRKHYPAWGHPAWDDVSRQAIIEWRANPHYKLKVFDLMVIVEDEEKERRRANAEPDEATEVATVADEDEERMRREYLAAEVEEVEAPAAGGSGSAWGGPAPADGGLRREMALSEADFVGQWSAPTGPHPTGFESTWPSGGF